MRFFVVTVLPEIVDGYCQHGLLGKACADGRVTVETISPREHATDRHRSVDDTPYGGGGGMVMMPGPLLASMEAAEQRCESRPLRVLLSPQGEPLTHGRVCELAESPAITLVCGRYEGVDERARRAMDREISVGDFVLMGGELGALAVIEACARLVPGVLGNPTSASLESHVDGRLEHPHYTRPAEFRGEGVPAALLSGDHKRIARWRRVEGLRRTRDRRPDLFEALELSDAERAELELEQL